MNQIGCSVEHWQAIWNRSASRLLGSIAYGLDMVRWAENLRTFIHSLIQQILNAHYVPLFQVSVQIPFFEGLASPILTTCYFLQKKTNIGSNYLMR